MSPSNLTHRCTLARSWVAFFNSDLDLISKSLVIILHHEVNSIGSNLSNVQFIYFKIVRMMHIWKDLKGIVISYTASRANPLLAILCHECKSLDCYCSTIHDIYFKIDRLMHVYMKPS